MAGSISNASSSSGSMPSKRRELRSQSFSSDRGSVSTLIYSSGNLPSSVAPEAAFINESSASQIITNSFDAFASTWYDQEGIEPSAEPVRISATALQLVNGFLDQLLFNFLQVAKSTSLAALRPAVGEILKPKLARDTIHNANEELREYLGDADEDEYAQPDNDHRWDLELAWKRARLRCMVYSSLGELEEEDEDLFMQQENLETLPSQDASEAISAAVAIFLTSVIEYMGELTLAVAGQSAFQRMQSKIEKATKDGTHKPNDVADCIVVEEKDMERVAFDRTLGRLWRAWKKKLRFPAGDSPPVSFTGLTNDGGDADEGRKQTIGDVTDDASRSLTTSPSLKEKDGLELERIELYETEQLSEDESESAAKEFLTLARRRPVSLGDTPTYVSGLQIAVIAERHPAVLMLHRRFSMPSPRAPTMHRDLFRTRTFSRASTVPESPLAVTEPRRRPPAGIRDSFGNLGNWELEETLEQATYEKAEIVKSSRVSVASISSRSFSDFGSSGSARGASGDHSARIIDVPAPKSPVHPYRQSMDAADRCRPSNQSSPNLRSNFPFPEEAPRSKVADYAPRFGFHEPLARSAQDKLRSSLQSASIISESDEESSEPPPKASVLSTTPPAPPAPPKDPPTRVPNAGQTSSGQVDRKMPSPKADAPPPVTKVTILRGPHIANILGEDEPPEVPRKPASYPMRHSSRGESKNSALLERTKSRDIEEEPPVPLHSAAPPRQIHTSGSSGSAGAARAKPWKEESSSRAENVFRNFEELIQSNQTISYTLTPENMRDINVKAPTEGSVVSKIRRKSEDLRSPVIEGSGPPLSRRATQGLSTSSADGETYKANGPIPRAPPGLAFSTGRFGGPQARDARVTGESLADFAEFIKFTGPMDKGSSVLRNSSVPPGVGRKDLASRRVSTASSHSNLSSNSRHRYRNRDSHPEMSDHAEFVHHNPSQAAGSQHRIPRHVAPFRTTMDSDQFNGISGGKAVDAILPDIRYSQGSHSFTENTLPSAHSANSSSALLRRTGSGSASKAVSDEEMVPVRKRRPPRDPYAIDSLSDGEDYSAEVRPPVPRKKEESLAEFLRNYEPPSQGESQPAQSKASKKGRGPGLMGRFTRSGSKDAADHSGKEASGSNGKMGSKHVPLVIDMPPGYNKYGPIPGYIESLGAAAKSRTPMRNELRDSTASGEASDLSDLIRRTGVHTGQGAEATGFSKTFSRQKKTTST